MKTSSRHAFIEAEACTAIAHQIRIVRQQRGLSQKELAKMIGTTQAAISRIEDPSYGRLTVSTLIELAKAFDVGLSVKFVSIVKQFKETRVITKESMQVCSFEEESKNVIFYSNQKSTNFLEIHTNVSIEKPLIANKLLKDGVGSQYLINPNTQSTLNNSLEFVFSPCNSLQTKQMPINSPLTTGRCLSAN